MRDNATLCRVFVYVAARSLDILNCPPFAKVCVLKKKKLGAFKSSGAKYDLRTSVIQWSDQSGLAMKYRYLEKLSVRWKVSKNQRLRLDVRNETWLEMNPKKTIEDNIF